MAFAMVLFSFEKIEIQAQGMIVFFFNKFIKGLLQGGQVCAIISGWK